MRLELPTLSAPPSAIGGLPVALPAAKVEALYVHIPFCFHKCHYCDFYSITRQTPERMGQFVARILEEARLWSERKSLQILPESIFFGGGTPSLLPLDLMKRLTDGLAARFDLSGVREWTVEINPATADEDYCRVLRAGGVDRVSFGAQSFDRAELATLERHHDPDQVGASVELARRAGFSRINLDLIYAIPGQTQASWERSLEAAIALRTPHLSCYGLTYEPNTALSVRHRLGQFHAAPESLELDMLRYTRARLRHHEMPPYEISNYAIAGEACQHNLVYWHGGNYLGLGPSAASHISGMRWKNRAHLREWENAIDGGNLPASEFEQLEPGQRSRELAMLTLRLEEGLIYTDFAARTGEDARTLFAAQIGQLSRHGLIVADETAIRLTERGIEVADAVAAEFFLAPE